MSKRRRILDLAHREYLPMAATIAFWAVIVAAIGHPDTARLLAAVTGVRAIQLLTKFATAASLKRREEAPLAIRRQAWRFALNVQLAALATALILVAGLAEGMKALGRLQVAAFLPFVALGMPARYLRFADIRTSSPYYRLALAGSGLAMALIGWAAGWHAAAFGLAFGAREWIAYIVMRLWPRAEAPARNQLAEPLGFAEIARYSAILGRRLLTYRLSKTLLTVFGPFGNIAARTGRGLKWHAKVEPYVPHHLGGFLLFSAGTLGTAVFLVLRSAEPAAMVGAAGLLQIGMAAANVVLLWPYLPDRHAEAVHDDDDDDD